MEQSYQSLRQSNRQVTLTPFSLHTHGAAVCSHTLNHYTGVEVDTVYSQILKWFINLFLYFNEA